MENFNFGRGRSRLFQHQNKRLRPQSPMLVDAEFDQQDDFMFDFPDEEIDISIGIVTALDPIVIENHNIDAEAIVMDAFIEYMKGSKLLQGIDKQVIQINYIYIY